MAQAPTFLRAFYAPTVYARQRHTAGGIGATYSLALYAAITFPALLVMPILHPGTTPMWHDPRALFIVAGYGLVLRAVLLSVLTLAARMLAVGLKTPLSNKAAARVTAVAYTPVAVLDAVAFLGFGTIVSPPLLFGGGVVMLLAALYTTK